eukprot:1159543-Pelagomonas_calceolata.AAC.7
MYKSSQVTTLANSTTSHCHTCSGLTCSVASLPLHAPFAAPVSMLRFFGPPALNDLVVPCPPSKERASAPLCARAAALACSRSCFHLARTTACTRPHVRLTNSSSTSSLPPQVILLWLPVVLASCRAASLLMAWPSHGKGA